MVSNGFRLSIVFFLAAALSSSRLAAETPSPANPSHLDVSALLRQRCVKCHGPAKHEAELNLSTLAGLARGGESGPPIIPGDPSASLLWRRVADEEMPPDDPLAVEEKTLLRQWIEQGAVGLPPGAARQSDEIDHWAFRPLVRPPVPDIDEEAAVHNHMDRFLSAQLGSAGLSFSPPADRATLLRRVAFDLTGLPPTVEEIAAYLADPAPDAYERMVERCLASSHYGERWGRHWLDVAGYADSNGYFHADTDRPLAYRYRDYVIRSFNEDKPFDQFIREQLAGDQLVGYEHGGEITPDMIGPLVATHFLRNAQDGTGESDGNPLERHVDRVSVIEGAVEIVGSALLGLTVQCARCHDHKFEPISQLEYYRLQAIFASAYNLDQWLKPNERVAEVDARAELDSVADRQGDQPPDPERISFLFESTAATKPHHLLLRGDYQSPGTVAAPGVPAVLCTEGNLYSVASPAPDGSVAHTQNARAEFARWITDPRHPTLARITVNRIWQRYFGRGLVATPDNLGLTGAAPSHPELLDFLAAEFIAGGWSVKSLHRMILHSGAYRQASASQTEAKHVDPQNRLLWKFPLRRLDADCVRDACLAASGRLDRRAGGPYVPTERLATGEVVVSADVDGASRRGIYLQQRRSQVLSMLDVFDAPAVVTNCTRRATSTTPLQALTLLNSDFVDRCAAALADRVSKETGSNPADRVARAFLLVLGRGPRESERTAALRFLREQQAEYADASDPHQHAWVDFCRALLASNAFLYVE